MPESAVCRGGRVVGMVICWPCGGVLSSGQRDCATSISARGAGCLDRPSPPRYVTPEPAGNPAPAERPDDPGRRPPASGDLPGDRPRRPDRAHHGRHVQGPSDRADRRARRLHPELPPQPSAGLRAAPGGHPGQGRRRHRRDQRQRRVRAGRLGQGERGRGHRVPGGRQRRLRQGDRPGDGRHGLRPRHPLQALFHARRGRRGADPQRRGIALEGRGVRRRGPPEGL